jgi:arylsulfatase A
MMDLLPTFARLAGSGPPENRIIDGHDIWPLASGEPDAKSRYKAFYYYYMGQLQAVRSGKWKLHLPLEAKLQNFGGRTKACPAELYDLNDDVGESRNVVKKYPGVVTRLLALADKARADLGDHGRAGKNQRPAGIFGDPRPQLF